MPTHAPTPGGMKSEDAGGSTVFYSGRQKLKLSRSVQSKHIKQLCYNPTLKLHNEAHVKYKVLKGLSRIVK